MYAYNNGNQLHIEAGWSEWDKETWCCICCADWFGSAILFMAMKMFIHRMTFFMRQATALGACKCMLTACHCICASHSEVKYKKSTLRVLLDKMSWKTHMYWTHHQLNKAVRISFQSPHSTIRLIYIFSQIQNKIVYFQARKKNEWNICIV